MIKRIKVFHVYKSFDVYNGLIEILTILARGMDPERFELGAVVFRYSGNAFGEAFEKLGGKIYNLDVKGGIPSGPRKINVLRGFLGQNKPHIVQSHALKSNLYTAIAARMSHVPVVICTEMTLKDTAHSPLTRARDRVVHPLLSMALSYCDCFMVTSEFIKNQWYQKRHAEKFRVIYPPFSVEKYEAAIAAGASPEHGSAGQPIGYVGRLSEEKGVMVLIQAMPEILRSSPRAQLLVVGTGPQEQELRETVRALGLGEAVRFLGFCENVFTILKRLDALVIPSRSEGAPIVVAEAGAMGVPVVATTVGGIPEMVVNGVTGMLVPPNSPQSIARAVTELLGDKAKAARMGEEGRRRAFKEYHPAPFVRAMEDLYLELCARKIPSGLEAQVGGVSA